MLRRLALPALLLLAVPACSGEVILPGETSASTGAGGSPTSGTSVSTGVGGGSSVTTGVGGGVCGGETHDTFKFVFASYQGHTYGCEAEAGDSDISAEVVDNSGTGDLTLDSCGPAADCPQLLSKLTMFTTKDFFVDIPMGTYIRVQTHVQPVMGSCEQRVLITNLPSWQGVPNPMLKDPAVWVLAADGDANMFVDTPVEVDLLAQGCYPAEPPSCGAHDDYVWRFRASANAADQGTTVPMGVTSFWNLQLQGVQHLVQIRNLKSFSLGICDGPVDFAYWMTHKTPLD